MARLRPEDIEEALPDIKEVGVGLENGYILVVVHQGQITKVQEALTGRTKQRRPQRSRRREVKVEDEDLPLPPGCSGKHDCQCKVCMEAEEEDRRLNPRVYERR